MPTPPGYADVSIQLLSSVTTRPAYVTFAVDPTATDPAIVASSVSAAFSAPGSVMSRMDSNVTFSQIRVSLGTDGGEDLVYMQGAAAVGAIATTSFPPNSALLVHKSTARGGRRGRGRMFFPWMVGGTDCPESGIIQTSALGNLQTVMSNFRIALASGGVPMYLLHGPSTQGTVHPTAAGPPDAVLSLTVDKLISTQRRRLGR